MFKDRIDAGRQLANALDYYKGLTNGVVVAIPRGGVVPGKIISDQLELPLEMIMVKKIGHPENPEYAIGAVSMKSILLNRKLSIDQRYIDEEITELRDQIRERYRRYYGDRRQTSFSGKVVIVVDDGVATGYTLMAALDMIRQENPVELVAAVPVAPIETYAQLTRHADRVVCLETPANFNAISRHYASFEQVGDDEVMDLIHSARHV